MSNEDLIKNTLRYQQLEVAKCFYELGMAIFESLRIRFIEKYYISRAKDMQNLQDEMLRWAE